jgi:arylsulfatase A-like enzyme
MLKGYFAAVTAMDTNVGRILKKIEERGLRQDTLLIFMSDNGFSCGHHGFWGKGNGTTPRNMYENSIKVPAIFSHPGMVPEGAVEKAMVSAYDFLPTLLEYLSLPVPAERNLPGRSFLPLLRGQKMEERDNVVIYDEYGPVRMIRTKEWKYVYRHAYGPHELYDLLADPDERKNLADDPAQAKKIQELKAAMDDWFARYVNPRRDGLREDGAAMGQSRFVPG